MAEKVVIGNATLYLADCREVLPSLPARDLLLTDPPYGIGYTSRVGRSRRLAGVVAEDWDDEPPPDWVFGLMLDKSTHAIVWGGNHFPLPIRRGWLSWFKPDGPPSYGQFELAWTNLEMNCQQFERNRCGKQPDSTGHQTQKPQLLMEWCIGLAPVAETVCDPFMGSGTTGVACAKMGVAFTGIERERRWFDVACERISRAQAQGSLLKLDSTPAAVQQVMEL